MTNNRHILIIAAVLLAISAAAFPVKAADPQILIDAGVPLRDAAALSASMESKGFDDHQINRVATIVRVANQKGLPTGPIIDKAFEGVAKNAPPDRIVQAMEAVLSRYGFADAQARRFARNPAEQQAIRDAVADGLAAGMSREDAGRIAQHLGLRRNSVPDVSTLAAESFRAARDMSRMGVRSQSAADVVGRALNQGFNAADMAQMGRSFKEDAARGNPGDMAGRYADHIDRGIGPAGLGRGDGPGHGGAGSGSGGPSGGPGPGSGGPGGAGGGGPGGGGGSGGGRH